MDTIIYNPLEDYQNKFKELHFQKTSEFFESLVEQSKVNIEENRETVRQYNLYKENLAKLKRKLTWFKVLRVLMIITLILIPLVILKTTPRIKELKDNFTRNRKCLNLDEYEYRNMLTVAELVIEASLNRKESIGAHARIDSVKTLNKELEYVK